MLKRHNQPMVIIAGIVLAFFALVSLQSAPHIQPGFGMTTLEARYTVAITGLISAYLSLACFTVTTWVLAVVPLKTKG